MATQTPTTQYDKDLEKLNQDSELLQEEIGLLNRLREIALQRQGVTVAPVAAAPATTPTVAKVVAPKKKKAAAAANTQRAGVPTEDGKSVDLPTLLETIGQQVNKPLSHPDFVTLVRNAGYTTKAKDFSNMVYQALLKLVKRGTFRKNNETRTYEYIGKAA